MRRYALARSLLDVPNGRSSHSIPTPRGGGVAFVITFLGSLFLLRASGGLATTPVMAFAGAGSWVALVGFLDDHGHIPARWRLLAHFLGAAWVLAWSGGMAPLPIFGSVLDLGWLGNLAALIYLVWLLNLYNFMDGIDGIAGIEAITVCVGGGLLLWISALGENVWLLPVLLAASVAGFLFWNFPSAKIFMGDVGSGFLGMMLGALSIQATWLVPKLFWCWTILLGVFVVDATVTLVRRILRGEKFYEAHRSHAYQYASRYHRSHQKVSLATGVINLFWLLPVAALVAKGTLDGFTGVGIAYAPLVWTALKYKAGAPELQKI
ncbi:MAG: glycosyltransferase family 4 protein [Desulfobacteraceae bacterium]|nr:glycosyltransferase family 4 protein [Desulfobacteraceae bacterium]